MTNQRYYHMATIACKHLYFKDGDFRSIEFSIEKDSAKLLNDFGIVIKKFSGGIHLLSNSPELFISANNDISLKFYLNCSDPYYISYTNLKDYSPINDVLYFNNINPQLTSEEKNYSLQNSEFVKTTDVLPLSYGSIEIPEFNPLKTYTFHDALNNEIPNDLIQELSAESGKYIINGLTEGVINVKLEEQTIHRIYYTPNTIWNKPFGILELFTDNLYNHFKSKGLASYIINFNNRSTLLKYFLVGPIYQSFENLNILNKNKEIVFNPPEKQKIQDSMNAIVFTSKNKHPLLEYTEDHFQLIDNYDPELRDGNVIIKNMAQATPEQLFIEQTSEKEIIYSHIYLH